MPPKLDEVCAAHPIVLQCIKRYLGGDAHSIHPDVKNLRCVNRNLRTAVDRSQERLVHDLKRQPVLRLRDDLASRFDAVNSLCIKVPRTAYKENLEEEEEEDAKDGSVLVEFLEQLQRQPVLLAKLQQLHLGFDVWFSESIQSLKTIPIGAVVDTLSRCTRLQELEVKLYPSGLAGFVSAYTFKPQGATPQQRAAATLQRQIAAFAASPDFLAPSTWPQHACLTAADIEVQASDAWPCLLPQNILAATSLVQLTVLFKGDGCDLAAFTALRHLSLLTRLDIRGDTCEYYEDRPMEQFLSMQLAIAEMPRLRSLLVGDCVFDFARRSSVTIPEAWSHMKELRQLQFVDCCIDPAEMAHCSTSITLLRLESDQLLGRMSSLTPLAALRALELGEFMLDAEEVVDSQLLDEEKFVWLQVPHSWTRELRCLQWACTAECLSLLPQLQGLMRLALYYAVVTPHLCRSLCQLSQLEGLWLWDSTATDEALNHQEAQQLLPCLPASVRLICITAKDPSPESSPLQAFARCVQVPESRSNLPCVSGPASFYQSYLPRHRKENWIRLEAVSLAWVKAILYSWDLRSTSFVLPDDRAVHVMLTALESVCGGQASDGVHCSGKCGISSAASTLSALERIKLGLPYTPDLVLGPGVTPAAFQQLFLSPHLPSSMLSIRGDPCKKPEYHEPVPTAQGVPLNHDHVSALVGASTTTLQHLELWDCSALTDEDFALLARAAPALQCLLLGKAANLTDAGLATLAACTKLSRLHLSKASCVTPAGLMQTRADLPSLATLIVKGVEPAFVAAVQQACSEQQQSPVGQQWAVPAITWGTPAESTVELRVRDGGTRSPAAGREMDASGSAAGVEDNPAQQLSDELWARLRRIMEGE